MIRRSMHLLLFLLFAASLAHAQSTCTVTGTLTNLSGQPAAGVRLRITPIAVGGASVTSAPIPATSDALGVVTFTVIQGAVVRIEGAVVPWNQLGGQLRFIPNASTALLSDLQGVVTVLTSGETVKQSGTALTHRITVFDFLNATVTESPTGEANITVTPDWSVILNKPSSFTPSAHASTHQSAGSDPLALAIAQITGLQTALDSKAALSHAHAATDITGGLLDPARLTDSGVTPGSCTNCNLTIDAKGRVTVQANGSGGGGTPGGSDTQIQFNDAGLFGGDAGLVYNKTTNLLTITGGNISVPGSGANSERFGDGADTSTGTGNTAAGKLAFAGGGNDNLAGGFDARVFGSNSVALGALTRAAQNSTIVGGGRTGSDANESTLIGADVNNGTWNGTSFENGVLAVTLVGYGPKVQITGAGGCCVSAIGASNVVSGVGIRNINILGDGNLVNHSHAIVLGGSPFGTRTTADHQFTAGWANATWPDAYISEVYFGSGVVSDTPQPFSLKGTGGNGTNIGGANVTIAGGQPTGSGMGGSVIIATAPPGGSGGSLQALVNRIVIPSTGDITISSPSNTLSLQNGTTSQALQIHSSLTDADNRKYAQLNMFNDEVRLTNIRRASGGNNGGNIKIITNVFAEETNTWQFDFINAGSDHTRLIPLENNGQDFGGPSNQIKSGYFGTSIRLKATGLGASGDGVLVIGDGTAPGTLANAAQFYTLTGEATVKDGSGNATTISPHNFRSIPLGPSEPLAWSFHSERDGVSISVDMLRVIRLLEKQTGETLVFIRDVKTGQLLNKDEYLKRFSN